MKNLILSFGLCISLISPSVNYASLGKTFKQMPTIPQFNNQIRLVNEASSLSELDDADLEQRILRLPLPDGAIRIPVINLFGTNMEYRIIIAPVPGKKDKEENNDKYRLPLPSMRIK